ncbi:MAG: hypothetical protein IKV67_01405 [Paludibacteraceae bacterium]|jgi:hypothetical protein|nr:hypothetical protein [Paludibacteraceae bacterium]
MIRKVYTFIFAFILNAFNLFAQEYSTGDVIEKDGISYKVLVTYLVTNPKESPDAITGPDKFYQAGEIMAIKVDENLTDVVIPSAVGRFKVVGLTDSLFYRHEHNRIWLPDLVFAGNHCFSKLKVRSGALVIHGLDFLGTGVFDELAGDLIFDTSRAISWGKTFEKKNDTLVVTSRPKGAIKFNTKMLRYIKYSLVYDDCYTAQGNRFKRWVSKAFNDDEEFMKHDLTDKMSYLSKRGYTTTSRMKKRGLKINSGAVNVKLFDEKTGKVKPFEYPWGNLTQEFRRQARYTVSNKKSGTTSHYNEFIPVADATLKEGWYVKFIGDEGEVKYTLNGKLIK